MPTYDYDCERCGAFTENRPMAEFALPQPCPACGAQASRALANPMMAAGAKSEPAAASPFRSHSGGCACCAPPPRRFSAEAV